MGLYDAVGGRPEQESTAAAAAALRSPVVLVVDVAAMGQSVAALVHGFRSYDEQLWLGGVILNRVASSRHEAMLREALDDVGVPVYGALRRQDLPAVLPSRRHGVAPVVDGSADAVRAVRRLGEAVAATVDLERLLGLARSAPELPAPAWSPEEALGAFTAPADRPLVALAGGPGGSFSHPETAELLRAMRRRDRHRRSAARRGTAGGHPRAGHRRRAARGVRRAVVGQPAALHRGGRAGADRASGGRRGRRAALAGPGVGRAADVRCPGRDRRQPGRSGGRLPGGDRPDRQRGRRPGHGAGRPQGAPCGAHPRAGQRPAWSWEGGTPEGFVWRNVHASQLTVHWAGHPATAARLVAAAAEPTNEAVPAQPGGVPA